MPDPRFEVHHGDNGLIDDFETLEEAEECARELIEEERKESFLDGEWGDNAERIEIRYKYTVQRSFFIRHTNPDNTEYYDVQMRTVSSPVNPPK